MSDAPGLWNELARIYDRTRAFEGDAEADVPRRAAELLRSRGAVRVLDLGCGTGRYTLPFLAAGLRAVGVDRSPEMMARLVEKRPGAPVVRCDAFALPFRDRTFDALFTSHVLHLVGSMERLAEAAGRVLRPRAIVVDADTTYVTRPVTSLVIDLVFPQLEPGWTPWPRGERSRMRDLLDDFTSRLGGADVEVVPCAEWAVRRSLREVLDLVRARLWSTIRVHAEDRVRAAADAAERALVTQGHDLDEPREDREGVRFLVARLRS